VAAAARANGAALDFDQIASRFTLTFGKAFPGRMTG
jgi:aryl carrier-like protein